MAASDHADRSAVIAAGEGHHPGHAAECLIFRRLLGTGLNAMSAATLAAEPAEVPVLVLAVLACILAGFATTSLAGINPVQAATAGAAAAGEQRVWPAEPGTTARGVRPIGDDRYCLWYKRAFEVNRDRVAVRLPFVS
jgi:hypothetical protein